MALKVTGRHGPRTLEPGDPLSGCKEVMGRGRYACLLCLEPGQARGGSCESRRASSPRRRARAVGPASSLCLPQCRASGRVVCQSGVARGSGARPQRLGPPGSSYRGAASAALRWAKRANTTPPTVGTSLRPQSRWMLFLSHRDV